MNTCPYDTNYDGDCHLCARDGICRERPPSHIRDLLPRSPHDWPTQNEENGNYSISCACGVKCLGPKRAYICYVCYRIAKAALEAMTPEERDTHEKKLIEIAQQVLGERLGRKDAL